MESKFFIFIFNTSTSHGKHTYIHEYIHIHWYILVKEIF